MKASLTLANINVAVNTIVEYMHGQKMDKRDILKIRLGLEEALLRFRERFGEDTVFLLKYGRVFKAFKVELSVPGAMFDPFVEAEDDESCSLFMRSALANMGRLPVWRYNRGQNTVVFGQSQKGLPEWLNLLISILAALVLGLALRIAPENVRVFIQSDVLEPLLDTFMGFLNALAGPMIFLSVLWGIYSMGDAEIFNVLGKKVSRSYMISLCAFFVISALCSIPFFRLSFGGEQGGGDFSSLYHLILDIVPSNLITPFSSGNTLQILFLAIIIGITMIVIGEKIQSTAMLTEQLSYIVQSIMKFIGKMIPFFIFGSLVNIISSSEFGQFSVFGKFFLGTIAACSLILLLHTILTSVKLHLSPIVLWKKSFSTFLIGLTTASSSASFATNLSTCVEKYGMNKKLASFGVPFGQVLYKPGMAITYFIAILSTAEFSEIGISVMWIISALIMCIILSAATPTIPGGSTASFSLLFLQLGLPTESLPLVLALNIMLDFFHTATNLFCDQCILLLVAEKLEMLDRELLLR